MNGAQVIARQLQQLGVRHVFGLPGTQNGALYCELQTLGVSLVPAVHEMGAGFEALGYAACSDQPSVLAVIGGPGASYAATALLEAMLDSIPIVCLVCAIHLPPGRRFGTQQIDHVGLGAVSCKRVLVPKTDDEISSAILQAWELSQKDEPGPVMVLVDANSLSRSMPEGIESRTPKPYLVTETVVPNAITEVLQERLQRSTRPLFFAGRGAVPAASELRKLAEHFSAPVITTTSARGIVPEDHPLSLRIDGVPAKSVNDFLREHCTVFAWGVKFSQNGGKGYKLALTPEKLVHIDSSGDVLNSTYPTAAGFVADAPAVIKAMLARTGSSQRDPSAVKKELSMWRQRMARDPSRERLPFIRGVQPSNPAGFFRGLRRVLPDDAILVLDSGLHQSLARSYFPIHAPHGLLLPTGLQSMGFSIPAALGSALAAPGRRVVVLMGDGGLRMCGMELLSAVAARIPLVTIVFDDGYFGLIRHHQWSTVGVEAAVRLPPMKYETWCTSLGICYFDGSIDPLGAIGNALEANCTCLVQVPLIDTLAIRAVRLKEKVRRAVSRNPILRRPRKD